MKLISEKNESNENSFKLRKKFLTISQSEIHQSINQSNKLDLRIY